MIIDATNLVVGRLGSFAAKKAMHGEQVDIVNCENAVISGSKIEIIANYKNRKRRGTPIQGPFISRMPDRFVRRMIRGMLPYKKEKGEKAFKRIMCHIGVPKEFEGKKFETVQDADATKRLTKKYLKVADLCKEMGAKI